MAKDHFQRGNLVAIIEKSDRHEEGGRFKVLSDDQPTWYSINFKPGLPKDQEAIFKALVSRGARRLVKEVFCSIGITKPANFYFQLKAKDWKLVCHVNGNEEKIRIVGDDGLVREYSGQFPLDPSNLEDFLKINGAVAFIGHI